MSVGRAGLAAMYRELTEMAGKAFDATFDADRQERRATPARREEHVLAKGAELQARFPGCV